MTQVYYYCTCCHEPCDVYLIDEGIGDYEYWGSKETHVLMTPYSECCRDEVTTKPPYKDKDE